MLKALTNRIPKPHDLPRKPLIEAIFELRWALQQGPAGESHDPGFQILLGRFYDRVSPDFPELEDLPVSLVPEAMAPNVVRHRFRKAKGAWPLIQLGPGVLSVNDTEGYTWQSFRPMLVKAVQALFEAYPTRIAQLSLSQATLRYVNAVPLDSAGGDTGLLPFLGNHLHTNISIDPSLFDNPQTAGTPAALQLRLNYPLERPHGVGAISFSTGMKENVPSVIWENLVVSKAGHLPATPEAFDAWFEDAHALTDRWFFALCRGGLLTSCGGDNNA